MRILRLGLLIQLIILLGVIPFTCFASANNQSKQDTLSQPSGPRIVLLQTVQESIHPTLPDFIFKLYGYTEKDSHTVRKLEIIRADKPNEVFQKIIFPRTEIGEYPSTIDSGGFTIEDMNFDGYKDFRLQQWITTGANTPYRYWIWNQATSQFILNNELEPITSPRMDYENKEIVSYVRDGAARHIIITYKYIDGHILQTQMIQTEVDLPNNLIHITVERLKNGSTVTAKYDAPYPGPSYSEIEQSLNL
ncbi:MAG: hypothetical protein H6Q67_556 [Firmicutes bacterium]|nr:hypothetical protein [Bacillota bacterium]